MKLTRIPARNSVHVVDFPRLDGGLNLQELDYRLAPNESPQMKNLWWQDGVLQCRDGQRFVTDPLPGTGYTCCETLYHGSAFCHAGDKLYRLDPSGGAAEALLSGVPENRGTFFRYNEYLYYKNRGGFYRIGCGDAGTFSACDLTEMAYVPVVLLNADPATGAGDAYQMENRLSSKMTVHYNAAQDTAVYHLPWKNAAVAEVWVDGQRLAPGDDYTVAEAAGTVHFTQPPPVHDPKVNNTVAITCVVENGEARRALLECPYAAVHGASGQLCMVLGGSDAQPNAFFWNGNDAYGMNDTYFPQPFYQLAGDRKDRITGFGVQYGTLVVFKEGSVGKAVLSVEQVEGRDVILLTYEQINGKIGCDLPWTIALIENNLVFCSTVGGVHVLRESTAALENNVETISRAVGGTAVRQGLLQAVRSVERDSVCAFDDDRRYWLCAGGRVYLWDYHVSTWKKPSWFYFENVPAVAFLRGGGKTWHFNAAGRLTLFERSFTDYGGAIEKVYQFPPQFFGTYDRLKDVVECMFTIRSDTACFADILYQSDYEDRADLTPLRSVGWNLTPRNLAYRALNVQRFAHVARRRPGCRHVRHFAMRLSNAVPAQDLAILSAQIYFKFSGRER